MKEDEIKNAINETKKESKRPSTKVYLAVLIAAVALIGFYALVSGNIVTSGHVAITSPSQAQATSGGISNGIQSISGSMDAISKTLGIS